MGNGVRALIKLRCGNLEEKNKYWKKEENKLCVFCREGQDNMRHYVFECQNTEGGLQKRWGKKRGDIEENMG